MSIHTNLPFWFAESCIYSQNGRIIWFLCNSIVVSLLTESFDVAVFTVYSVLMNVNDLFTFAHFHLFQNMIFINNSNDSTISITFPLTLCTIHEYKTGNDVTLSYYPSPTHKSLIPKYSIHFCTQ